MRIITISNPKLNKTMQVRCTVLVAHSKCSTNSYSYHSIKFKTGNPRDETREMGRDQVRRRIKGFSFAHVNSGTCLTLKSEVGGDIWTGFMRHIRGSWNYDNRQKSQREHRKKRRCGQGNMELWESLKKCLKLWSERNEQTKDMAALEQFPEGKKWTLSKSAKFCKIKVCF